MAGAFETSKPTPRNVPLSTMPYLIILSKQVHQVQNKYKIYESMIVILIQATQSDHIYIVFSPKEFSFDAKHFSF